MACNQFLSEGAFVPGLLHMKHADLLWKMPEFSTLAAITLLRRK